MRQTKGQFAFILINLNTFLFANLRISHSVVNLALALWYLKTFPIPHFRFFFLVVVATAAAVVLVLISFCILSAIILLHRTAHSVFKQKFTWFEFFFSFPFLLPLMRYYFQFHLISLACHFSHTHLSHVLQLLDRN